MEGFVEHVVQKRVFADRFSIMVARRRAFFIKEQGFRERLVEIEGASMDFERFCKAFGFWRILNAKSQKQSTTSVHTPYKKTIPLMLTSNEVCVLESLAQLSWGLCGGRSVVVQLLWLGLLLPKRKRKGGGYAHQLMNEKVNAPGSRE